MKLNTTQHDHCIELIISGRIDTLTSPDLQTKLMELLDSGSTKIILNCQDVAYISSAGLRVFLISQKKAAKNDGGIVIFGLSTHLMDIFNVSGFTNFFSFANTLEEAIQLS